ncbi:MAG: helix-turn-helix domain-containing protein [Deltaproteobacteria bacterium]|nr:helix-turn-helix domain-containing protein [Deltaproteobacteria bacterium]
MPRKKRTEKRDFPEVMNLAEFMAYLRVGYGTAIKLLTSGEIPCKHFNRGWRIYKQDVIGWVRNGKQEVNSENLRA